MAAKLWWLIQKDLITEIRSKRAWPAMLLLGVVVAVVLTVQMRLLPDQRRQIVGALLWLAVFFSGLLGIDRSCSSEQNEGCWQVLLLYPVSPSLVYWSKFLTNVVALLVVECLLIPLFGALSDSELLQPLWAICLVALLASLGLSAVGTLLSALANGVGLSGQLLTLLVLPLSIPVLLAAAEATRLIAFDQIGAEWWRWVQLLGGFAVIFITAGTILIEFVIEE